MVHIPVTRIRDCMKPIRISYPSYRDMGDNKVSLNSIAQYHPKLESHTLNACITCKTLKILLNMVLNPATRISGNTNQNPKCQLPR